MQVWMVIVATVMGLMALTGHMTTGRLLSMTFLLGIGSAVSNPVWQATKDHSVIEADKLHQITWADGVIDHSLQRLIFCFANGFIKLFDVGMTNLCVNRSHHLGKWFRGNDAESFDRNLLRCYLILLR